jgi:tetratricopeptide (TPR) repeat protein
MRPLILLLLATAAVHAAVTPAQIENVRGLLREKKIAAAESAATALVTANPAAAEAHALLGSVYSAKGDGEAAVTACERAVELAPQNSEYQRQLGDACGLAAQKAGMLSKMSWAKKCRIAYEKAVELDANNISARTSLLGFYQMAPGMMGGGMDKAYEQAAAIKKLDDTRGRLVYAVLYAGEKKFAEAFTEYEAVLQTAPDNYDALYQFGKLTALTGDRIDRGMEALTKCLTLPPPAGSPGPDAAHWRLGNLWEKKGDKKSARAAYQAALAINPTYPPAIDALKKLE